jgi:hypothetical protein
VSWMGIVAVSSRFSRRTRDWRLNLEGVEIR